MLSSCNHPKGDAQNRESSTNHVHKRIHHHLELQSIFEVLMSHQNSLNSNKYANDLLMFV